jgi:hypothetical protein
MRHIMVNHADAGELNEWRADGAWNKKPPRGEA